MPLVGTSGHVNHGKSRLIEALTGVNPDRLPEEKERGMTIDLGFAWFPDKDGKPVGVIDVPGHERFLRNMTAGAWSLDCVLLVVAADEGWMAQTESHARVLRALGVTRVLPVITKIDLVSAERLAEAEAEVRSKCRAFFGVDRAPLPVSSSAGTGLEELREAIYRELEGLPPAKSGGRPFFYVDRVFSLKGSGLVAAGSLRGGRLAAGDELVLLPRGEEVRVRGLQSYNVAVSSALPGSRVAVNLSQVKEPPVRGDCLAHPEAPFRSAAEALAKLFDAEALRNHREAEIAFGSDHLRGTVHLLGTSEAARIVLERKAALCPGERFLLLRPGGSDLLGWGLFLWLGPTTPEERWRFSAFAKGQAALSPAGIETAMRGYSGPVEASSEPVPFAAVRVGDWFFDGGFLKEEEKALLARADRTGRATLAELQGVVRVPKEALKAFIALLEKEGKLEAKDGLYSPKRREVLLSKSAARLLADLEAAGKTGYEPDKAKGPVPREDLNFLCRIGRVVPLEAGIYLSSEVYRSLRDAVVKGRGPGSRFTVPEAKAATGLSRKYILPLLNRLEHEGFVKREGDERIVLKLP